MSGRDVSWHRREVRLQAGTSLHHHTTLLKLKHQCSRKHSLEKAIPPAPAAPSDIRIFWISGHFSGRNRATGNHRCMGHTARAPEMHMTYPVINLEGSMLEILSHQKKLPECLSYSLFKWDHAICTLCGMCLNIVYFAPWPVCTAGQGNEPGGEWGYSSNTCVFHHCAPEAAGVEGHIGQLFPSLGHFQLGKEWAQVILRSSGEDKLEWLE